MTSMAVKLEPDPDPEIGQDFEGCWPTTICHKKPEDEQSIGIEHSIGMRDVKIETRPDDNVAVGVLPVEPSSTVSNADKVQNNQKKAGLGSFKCDVCQREFKWKSAWWHHTQLHAPKKHVCHICNWKTISRALLKRHIEKHERGHRFNQPRTPLPKGEGPFKCDICQKEHKNGSAMNQHKKEVHGPKMYACDICGQKFSKRYDMDTHVQNLHERTLSSEKFKCDICQKELKSEISVRSHKRFVHGPKLHTCHICGYQFSKRSNLAGHVKKHFQDGEEPFTPARKMEDTQSSEKSGTESEKNASTTSLQTSEPKGSVSALQCAKCDKVCQTRTGLWHHYKYAHTEQHPCSLCIKVCPTEEKLEKHMAMIHLQQALNCDECEESFQSPFELRKHKKTIHAQFSCSLCSKKFNKPAHLKKHQQRIHRNDGKSLECKVCNKTFLTFQQKVAHMKAHEPKQHECNVCGIAYLHRKTLMNHLKTHDGYCDTKAENGKDRDADGCSEQTEVLQTRAASQERQVGLKLIVKTEPVQITSSYEESESQEVEQKVSHRFKKEEEQPTGIEDMLDIGEVKIETHSDDDLDLPKISS